MVSDTAAQTPPQPSVAVVGSGVAGLTAAYLLRTTHRVTLYEADRRLGGHAHTHDVADRRARLAIDTGFIVHNEHTYPLLRRLFDELDIATQPTEMSMSISDDAGGFCWAGGRGVGGILAQPWRLGDPRFVGMLVQIKQFHRAAAAFLDSVDERDTTTFGDFLESHRFGAFFRAHYAIPLVSCVWSTGSASSLDYPARYLFAFLRNHGMLSVTGSPRWFTVSGGSRVYVDRIASALGDVRLGSRVTDVARTDDGVVVGDEAGQRSSFDKVVIATHPDDAIGLLADPTGDEKRVLSAFGYSSNEAVLHTDSRMLPRTGRARASWNYRLPAGGADTAPVVTYWMNRLQRLESPTDYLVTLNATDRIDPSTIIDVMSYRHPVYTPAAVSAQRQLPNLNSASTAFAGAYHGWGFHEDGCRSGVAAARHFGAQWAAA